MSEKGIDERQWCHHDEICRQCALCLNEEISSLKSQLAKAKAAALRKEA